MTVGESMVFEITCTGTNVYAREVRFLLEQEGIKPFAPYISGKEDLLCAQILALKDVEFCSIEKIGKRVVVNVRLSAFSQVEKDEGCMYATRSGEILNMTVLRGTPLKKVGDHVLAGECLAGNWIEGANGGQVRVEIIARVRLACAWEGFVQATTEEEAFAKAYLEGEFSTLDTILSVEAFKKEGIAQEEIAQEGISQEEGYYVKIAYERIEKINL